MDVKRLLDEVRPHFDLKTFSRESPRVSGDLKEWASKFKEEYVTGHSEQRDDLLFFVKEDGTKEASTTVEVFRKDSKSLPWSSDSAVIWDQTFYLNLLLHEFEYHVTCSAITIKPGTDCLDKTMLKYSQQVYPSTTKRRMDKKDECEMFYPNITFYLDNFEEVFCDLCVGAPDEKIAIQLLAINKCCAIRQLVFIGAMDYCKLKETCEKKEKTKTGPLSSALKRLTSLVHNNTSGSDHHDNEFSSPYIFIRMAGPHHKGFAEMAVHKKQSGVQTLPKVDSSSAVPVNITAANVVTRTKRTRVILDLPNGQLERENGSYNPDFYSTKRLSSPKNNSTAHLSNGRAEGGFKSDKEEAKSTNSSNSPGMIDTNSADKLCSNQATLLKRNSGSEASSLCVGKNSSKNGVVMESSQEALLTKDDELSESFQRSSVKSVKRVLTKAKQVPSFSNKSKEPVHETPPLIHAYLTYIQLPWYHLMEDILNGTRNSVL